MWRLVAAIIFSASAFALGLHDVGITYRSYDPGSRLATMPGYVATQGIAMAFEITQGIDLLWLGIPIKTSDRLFYWRNVMHGSMESAQFRTVGWQFEIGVRPVPWLEIGRYHHSQHLLDVRYDWPSQGGFPVEDGFVVRLTLLQ